MAKKKSPARARETASVPQPVPSAPVASNPVVSSPSDSSLINNGAVKFVVEDQINNVVKPLIVDITEVGIVGEQAAADIGMDLSKLETAPGDRIAELARALKRAFIEERIFPDDPTIATPTVAFEVFVRARKQAEELKKNMLIWQT